MYAGVRDNSSEDQYPVMLSPELIEEYDLYMEQNEINTGSLDMEAFIQQPNNSLNIVIVAILLFLGLTNNIFAFPVMLFRRTKFGNGQFAVLVLCLTMADMLTVLCGLVGGLVLELGHMTWAGTSTGCSSYYFLSSWLLGLSNYLVSVLVGLVHVKRADSWLSRLAEVRGLLLVLTVATLLPALPELLVRSTISLSSEVSVCIISASSVPYALYVTFKLLVLHILPAVIVLVSILRPQTKVAKRFSSLFLGEGAVYEVGPEGTEVTLPGKDTIVVTGTGDRPDVVTSHKTDMAKEKSKELMALLKQHTKNSNATKRINVREDPHRRCYKRLISMVYLSCTALYLILDLSYQIQSVTVSQWDEVELGAGLATALLPATYIKQILNPIVLIYAEFATH